MSTLAGQSLIRLRAAFAWTILLASFGSAVASYRSVVAIGGGAFQSGDWLINYADGFVRRGLFGELLLTIAPKGPGGIWFLFAIQVTLYAMVLAYCLHFLHRNAYDWGGIALACSPAAIAFVGWDTGGFARKEVLVLVALVVLAVSRHGAFIDELILGVTALLLFVLAVFSWEASAFMSPAILFLLLRPTESSRSRWLGRALSACTVAIALAGLALSALHHGTSSSAERICNAVRDHGLDGVQLCAGAIRWIGVDSEQALREVRESFPLFLGFLPLALLALLPIVLSPWFQRHWRWALAAALAIAPLFVVATDFGRWTFMLVMELTICIMASGRDDALSPRWTPLAAVLFVVTWGMPHWLMPAAGAWPWLNQPVWPQLGALTTAAQFLGAIIT